MAWQSFTEMERAHFVQEATEMHRELDAYRAGNVDCACRLRIKIHDSEPLIH